MAGDFKLTSGHSGTKARERFHPPESTTRLPTRT